MVSEECIHASPSHGGGDHGGKVVCPLCPVCPLFVSHGHLVILGAMGNEQ